jgi:phosphoribosylformylglycinamidine cyclo-ligase
MPEGSRAVIERGSWTVPPVFPWLQRLGEIDAEEMDRVFNMGLGLVLVVSSYYAESIRHQLSDSGLQNWTIGQITAGPRGVAWG